MLLSTYQQLIQDVINQKNPQKAKLLSGYFKTGPGQYGEGDIFYGLTVPQCRKIVANYRELPITDIQKLISSKIHEIRLIALLILVDQYKRAGETDKKIIYEFYLKNSRFINNWDLVDLTAPKIVGEYLINKDRKILYQLAKSNNIWDRRIAVLTTFTFIKNGQYDDSIRITEMLLVDRHDLIHKAVGWMLREIGKRDIEAEEQFLKKYYLKMPRTMLRYAIEKFPEPKRRKYLLK
jgi:3-methyladenine DNA glycosylase AlkD